MSEVIGHRRYHVAKKDGSSYEFTSDVVRISKELLRERFPVHITIENGDTVRSSGIYRTIEEVKPVETFSEQEDLDMLIALAGRTVSAVLTRNADVGEPGRWRNLSVDDHVYHAYQHVELSPSMEDLEHAVVRLLMAIATMEDL